MIPSKQLLGLHCHVIIYVVISHNLALSSSLRRRIGELVPLVVDSSSLVLLYFTFRFVDEANRLSTRPVLTF